MKTKARDYQAKAKQRERRARATRDPKNREWQLILARAYRMVAEAESEAVKQPSKMAAEYRC